MSDTGFTVRRFSDDFAKLLRGRILSGDLQPGERLNEVHLAERYGISRSPIREALQALAGEGLVTFVAGRGAFVHELTSDEVTNLGEIREALESQAARLAAERATPEQLARLADSAAVDGVLDTDGSTDFHAVLLNVAGNPRLEFLGVSTAARLRIARTQSAADPDRVALATAEHREILDAIRAGDPDAAGAAMREHVARATESAARRVAG